MQSHQVRYRTVTISTTSSSQFPSFHKLINLKFLKITMIKDWFLESTLSFNVLLWLLESQTAKTSTPGTCFGINQRPLWDRKYLENSKAHAGKLWGSTVLGELHALKAGCLQGLPGCHNRLCAPPYTHSEQQCTSISNLNFKSIKYKLIFKTPVIK